jgi:hypothetical protein
VVNLDKIVVEKQSWLYGHVKEWKMVEDLMEGVVERLV